MTTSDIKSVIANLQKDGKLPLQLPQSTIDEISKSMTKYFGDIAKEKIGEFAEKAKEVAEETLKTEQAVREGESLTVTEGGSPATARSLLTEFLEGNGVANIGETMNMDFFLRIPREVAIGAGQFMAQNYDETRIDEFPALELVRVYGRKVPRGSEKDPAGPENGWDDDDGRWQAACEESGDEDAAKVFEETGRMIALKSSEVWQALGDGAGEYEDTLGNPYAPFAFNSGMDTNEIDRDEAEELGLLDKGEEAEPADVDFGDLLGLKSRFAGKTPRPDGKNAVAGLQGLAKRGLQEVSR